MAAQVIEFSPPESEGEGTPTEEELMMTLYDSDSEGEDNPMVSGPVKPFAAKVDIVASRSGARGVVKALINSGCTRCLISQPTVRNLGLRVRKLKQPMKFEHVDGTLVGGLAASHLTEPVQLKLGDHQETRISRSKFQTQSLIY